MNNSNLMLLKLNKKGLKIMRSFFKFFGSFPMVILYIYNLFLKCIICNCLGKNIMNFSYLVSAIFLKNFLKNLQNYTIFEKNLVNYFTRSDIFGCARFKKSSTLTLT